MCIMWQEFRGTGTGSNLFLAIEPQMNALCSFPNSLYTKAEAAGERDTAQAARGAQKVKVCFPGMSKIRSRMLDFIFTMS